MSIRLPFAWEDEPDPLAGVGSVDPLSLVALPDRPDIRPSGLAGGERQMGGRSPRDVRDELERTVREQFGDNDYAKQKAATALRSWDRGIATGSIVPPER